MDDNPPIWLLLVLSLLGVGLLIGAIHSYVWTRNFLRRAIDADGIVVGYEEGNDEGATIYYLKVEFEARDHTKHELTGWHSTTSKTHLIGQAVHVLYDPDRPQDARISTQLNGGELSGSLMGAMFLIPGLIWLWNLCFR